MKTRIIIFLLLVATFIAHADPVVINPQSLVSYWIVVFGALLIETGIVTLALFTTGILLGPAFITLAAANIAVFLFAFVPLATFVSVWVLEPAVVVVDALAIKLFVAVPLLQGADYVGVSWRRALFASLLGNTASFFVGVLGGHTF